MQLAGGVWLLFELSPVARGGITGDSWLATGLFLVAIAATLGLLHLLATIALGDTRDVNVRRCVLLFVAVVLFDDDDASRGAERRKQWPLSPGGTCDIGKDIRTWGVNGIGNRDDH